MQGTTHGNGTEALSQRGAIEVSPQAIATVAGRAAAEVPGIAGIADKHLRFGTAELQPVDRYARGVEVHFAGERIIIDIYVIVEHGPRISEVAQAAIVRAKAAVEAMLGLPIVSVNVVVQGLRVGEAS
jgi:uncharacterized alkaline shock family protein YloU